MGKPSKGDVPDYSHIFKDEQPGTPGMETAVQSFRSAAQRAKAFIIGLIFSAMALGFTIFGLGMAARQVYRYYAWPEAKAEVLSVTATEASDDSAEGGIALTYAFAADGQQRTGEFSIVANHVGFDDIASIEKGQSVNVHYPPGRPDLSTLRLPPVIVTIGFPLFCVPFLLLGLSSILGAIRGRPISVLGTPEDDGSITRGRFTGLALLCCLGAFAYMILTGFLFTWIIDLLIFILYVTVVIPVAMKRITAWLHRRKLQEEGKQHAARDRFESEFIEEDTPDNDSPPDAPDGLIAPLPAFREADLPDLPSPGKQLRNGILITLFIWGIVGTFLGFFVYPIYKSREAIAFKTTEGVVVSSRVKTSTSRSNGRSSTSHTPIIEYRYTVDGREHTNDDYTFMYMEASHSGESSKIVADHPAGKSVTVFYNPADPQEAVLDRGISPISWFLMLFIQPFVLLGLGLLIWLPVVPIRNRRLREFLFSPTLLPQSIPFWGTLQQAIDGLAVKPTGRLLAVLYGLATGYCATVIIALVAGGLFIGVENFTPGHLQKVGLYGLVTGGVFALLALFKRSARVTFDQPAHQLRVRSSKRDETIAFDDIACWQARMFTQHSGKDNHGGKTHSYLVEALSRDGQRTVPVHLFEFNTNALASEDMRRAVVRRTLHTFAEITASCVQPRLIIAAPPFSPDTQPADIADLARLVRKAARHASQYRDLR